MNSFRKGRCSALVIGLMTQYSSPLDVRVIVIVNVVRTRVRQATSFALPGITSKMGRLVHSEFEPMRFCRVSIVTGSTSLTRATSTRIFAFTACSCSWLEGMSSQSEVMSRQWLEVMSRQSTAFPILSLSFQPSDRRRLAGRSRPELPPRSAPTRLIPRSGN